MPAYYFYKYLTVTKNLKLDDQQITQIVHEKYEMYNDLFHGTAGFNVEYPQISITDTLQSLANIDRIDPLSCKCGAILAKCTCNDSYPKLCCVESLVFSKLYSPELVVQSTERSKQLKEKTKVN
jgi:hypothetical protein